MTNRDNGVGIGRDNSNRNGARRVKREAITCGASFPSEQDNEVVTDLMEHMSSRSGPRILSRVGSKVGVLVLHEGPDGCSPRLLVHTNLILRSRNRFMDSETICLDAG